MSRSHDTPRSKKGDNTNTIAHIRVPRSGIRNSVRVRMGRLGGAALCGLHTFTLRTVTWLAGWRLHHSEISIFLCWLRQTLAPFVDNATEPHCHSSLWTSSVTWHWLAVAPIKPRPLDTGPYSPKVKRFRPHAHQIPLTAEVSNRHSCMSSTPTASVV
jgi:hypothetical protein